LADYYSILSRAVASLDNNTPQARAELFERARNLLIDRIESERDRWTNETALAEVAHFDAATDRIEAEAARRRPSESIGRQPRYQPADDGIPPPQDDAPAESKRGIGRIVAFGAAGLLGLLLVGFAIYAFRGEPTTAPQTAKAKAPGAAVVAKAPEEKKAAVSSRPSLDGDELEPGVDGGSTDAGLPYYLRRQAVYYRSVYSPGMIVVDRSQRFLYLVQPQARALRYGIGVGGECDISAGLYRIKSKSQWPEWSPSPGLLNAAHIRPRLQAVPAIRLALTRCISKAAFPEFTAPTPRSRSARRPHSGASVSSMTTSWTSRSVSRSAPALWC
jgi:hypothetical protein